MKSKKNNPINLDIETITEITESQSEEVQGGSCWSWSCKPAKASVEAE